MGRAKKPAKAAATVQESPPVRHRPVITRGPDEFGRTAYRLARTCGASGGEHAARRLAEWDLNQHVLSLPPVPAGQRCQDPKRHGCRHWEPCALCEHQAPLFEAAEAVS